MLNAEVVKDDLAKSEVKPENQEEAKIVEEEVLGESVQDPMTENEQNNNTEPTTENNLERVTEIMAVETQEEAKQENQ